MKTGRRKIHEGEKINVVVPTGNFGNILAAYYAKLMGLPLENLSVPPMKIKFFMISFPLGCYDRNRAFMLTNSPSMDILISSNLERLIYRIAGNDPEKTAGLWRVWRKTEKYEITDEMKQNLQEFYGNYATEEETAGAIRRLYEETGYVMDTHTAVAEAVYEKYRQETKDETKTVIASTASPFKFTRSVMNSIDGKYDALSDFELVDQLSRIAGVRVPKAIEEIRTAPVLHDRVIAAEEMPQAVKEILGV